MQKTLDDSEKQIQKIFVPVKVCFRNVVKRFDIDTQTSYEDLQLRIGAIFKVPCQIKYQDDEFDMVVIENDVDFYEALKVIPNTGGILKLFLSEKPMSNETVWMNSLAKESPDNSFQVLQRPNSCTESVRKSPEECKKKKTHKIQKHRSKSPSNSCFSSDEEKDDHKKNRKVKKVDLLYKKMQQEMRPMMSEYRDEICAGIINSLEQHQQAMSNTVTKAILGRLEGAVIHSIHQSTPEKETSNTPPPKKKSPTSCAEPKPTVTLETDDSEDDDEGEDKRRNEMTAPTPLSGCRTKYHHQNVLCDACEQEIFGPRYKCGNCPDYDLCERCESIEGIHHPSHVFLKLHYPCPRAGRGPAGGFLGPLMRTNIYEEWDNTREKEVLLQKILDSSSEAESVTLERIGKKEDDPLTAARIQRKAEWKRLKKEARKSKKQMCRKMKQMHHQVQQQCQEAIFKQTCEPFKPTELPIFGVVDNELQIAMQKSYEENNPIKEANKVTEPVTSIPPAPIETSLIEIPAKSEVELATSSHDDAATAEPVSIESATAAADDVVKDTQSTQSVPEPVEANETECVPQTTSWLVEKKETADENVTSPTSSEDFIVVAKCFDTSVPLDDEWIAANHSSCTEDHDAVNACSFVVPKDSLISLEEPPQVPASPSEPEPVSVEPDNTPSVNTSEPVSFEPVSVPTDNTSHQSSVEPEGVNVSEPVEPAAMIPTVNTPAPISVEPVIMAEPSPVVNQEPTALSNDWDSNIMRGNNTSELATTLRTLSIEDIDPDHPDPKDSDQNSIRIRKIVAMNSQDDTSSIKRIVPVNIGNTQNNSSTSGDQSENQPDPVIQSQIDEYREIQRKHHVNEQNPPTQEQQAPTTQNTDSSQQNQPENQQNQPSEPMGWSNQFEGFVSQVVDGVANHLGPYFSGSASQYPPGAPHYPRTYAPTWVPPTPQQPPVAYFQNGNAQVITQGERSEAELHTLTEMGFFDIERNRRVLRKYRGNVQAAISELLESNDNEWHQTRH